MTDLPGIAAGAAGEALAAHPLALAPALLLLAGLISLLLPARAAIQSKLLPAGALGAALVLLANAGPVSSGRRVLSDRKSVV